MEEFNAFIIALKKICWGTLIVQRLAGQRDLSTTARYATIRDSQMAETQKKMDDKLSTILENQFESTAFKARKGPQKRNIE